MVEKRKVRRSRTEFTFHLWWDQQTADLLKMYHIKNTNNKQLFLKTMKTFCSEFKCFASRGHETEERWCCFLETAEIKSLSYSASIIITQDQNNDAYQQTLQRFFALWQEDEVWCWHDGIKAEKRTWLLPAVTMEIWGKRTYEPLMSVRGRVDGSVCFWYSCNRYNRLMHADQIVLSK